MTDMHEDGEADRDVRPGDWEKMNLLIASDAPTDSSEMIIRRGVACGTDLVTEPGLATDAGVMTPSNSLTVPIYKDTELLPPDYDDMLLDHPIFFLSKALSMTKTGNSLGARSLLWYSGEWTTDQKILLTAKLMDAVNDICRSGVPLSDLKRGNILLQEGCIKIIDLDTRSYTGNWGLDVRNLTVRSFGATIAGLWWEDSYPSQDIGPPDAPDYISDLIRACFVTTTFEEIYAQFSGSIKPPPVELHRSSSGTAEAWDGDPLVDDVELLGLAVSDY
ncbi:hypothetical protein B0H16DRAFT_1706080 [Mycena metata]|uniref:Protein kinase domain-containing protein n=1 Tax=Mycena metata TaxID=1033252 RepID=A0AAD7DU96_9AGAR|nr:hypothetical protein B0H16DRAFT_1706080 [Mycena metata]